MDKLRVVIVEDNLGHINELKEIFEVHFQGEIDLVGEAKDLTEANELIRNKAPQIVFLDGELGQENGLSLLDDPNGISYFPIVTTSYDDIAARAYNRPATQWLKKPLSEEKIRNALDEYRTITAANIKRPNLKSFSKAKRHRFKALDGTVHPFDMLIDEIMYIEKRRDRTTFKCSNFSKKTNSALDLTDHLKRINCELGVNGEECFSKANRWCIVNLAYVEKANFKSNGKEYIQLINGCLIPVGSKKMSNLFKTAFAKYLCE